MAKIPIHGWYPNFDTDGNFIELYGWDVILRQIFTVLVTRPGSRQWQPNFGCKLLDLLFDNVTTEGQYNDVIKSAFKWLPHITLIDVKSVVERLKTSSGYKVKITLQIGYNGETKSVNFIIPPHMSLLDGSIHAIKVLR